MKSSAFHLTFHLSGIKLMDMKLFTHKRERGRVIQNLRVVVDYLACPAAIHVSRSTRGDAITFQWLDQGDTDGVMHYVDSDAMRDAFFLVKTPDEAEAFLKASGPFRSFALGVDWSMFQKWQEYFKQQRRLGAAGRGWGTPPEQLDGVVLDRIIRVPLFEPLQVVGQPILAARADSVVECIAAVNYLGAC